MATRPAGERPPRPQVGDILIVIHDFQARGSDELTLCKGDRVELVERDDEFGDGWFLGRHLLKNNTGLFPHVYTRPSPKNVPVYSPPQTFSSIPVASGSEHGSDFANAPQIASSFPESSYILPTPELEGSSIPMPIQLAKLDTTAISSVTASSSPDTEPTRPPSDAHDSKVLNDTLNVINEHITHLRGSSSNGGLRIPHDANDSGSDYSVPLDRRMSYIQGEETDEEEDEEEHERPEVESWTADQVAEYLFTAGVEKQHCEVFRDQEISGEVLLGMDQSSLFIKAFDLGSVGRRLKTWHKIKALQDQVSHAAPSTRRTTQTWGSDAGSEDVKDGRNRTNTATMMSSISNRMSSHRGSSGQASKVSPTALRSPLSSAGSHESPTRAEHTKRPSAASIRDLHHARRHSSTDFRGIAPMGAKHGATPSALSRNGIVVNTSSFHKKQASFDRNWTLGNAFNQSPSTRPLSSAGLQDGFVMTGPDPDLQDSAVDLDRGYFSGTETDGRRRNVLRKRDSAAGHSRQSSYADEQRVRSATALSRHSRFGSVDSFRDPPFSPAVQKFFGVQSYQVTQHRKTASTNTTDSARPARPAKDSSSPVPIVTRIDTGLNPFRSPSSPINVNGNRSASANPNLNPNAAKQGFTPEWLTNVVNKPTSKGRPGMRAISDRLATKSSKDLTSPDGAMDSPGRTISSTASAEPSLEIDSPATGKSFNATPSSSKSSKRKGKKDTSAYTRGLQKISPAEAKKGADYYGWMKKKSSNLMTTWKPRFFVLKGRRLAYYYSEEDDQEKGLIDISFHRVLPAGNERLTGLHATLTGAAGASMGHEANTAERGNESVFIFKLTPPRAGLSRAVNFTKPMVHYFALPSVETGRLWMAALMKATIDRDDTQPVTTTYQQKTISLSKAKQIRSRPPALMNLEEAAEDDHQSMRPVNGLGIH
ncbi:hypothetical protein E4U46_000756 [Claviceps purpurea]|nr:hypothetical protein E4U46_000756 [Claviceps purpurea]